MAEMTVRVEETIAASVAWDDVTGKPSTFPPTINATASGAVAGNDARLTAGAAGTATVRALGTGATQAAAGNDSRFPSANAVMTATPGEIPDSEATDVAGIVSDFNELLAELRARNVIANI